MLQEIAAVGALALDSLKSLRLTRSNRAIIAKALGVLHWELGALVTNGDKILRMLRSHNNGRKIDLGALGQLLEDQHVIIRRINSELRRRRLRTALSIHAPQLSPLKLLVYGKRCRVELLLERVHPRRRFASLLHPAWLGRRLPPTKLPDNKSIDRSRRELRKIKAQVEELRQFIAQNFELHEVL